jgi:hypothetical protein
MLSVIFMKIARDGLILVRALFINKKSSFGQGPLELAPDGVVVPQFGKLSAKGV